tara:strand:- start:251 stop:370 length:120 start_codon:yes stop_codon:yes gene_type:complete
MGNFSGVIKSSRPMKFAGQGKSGAAKIRRAAKKRRRKKK